MDEATSNVFKIAKGASIIFLSGIISSFLGFLVRWLIIKNYSVEDYGVFSIAISIIGIFSVVFMLGLGQGIPRQIGFYLGQNKKEHARGVFYSSLKIIFPVAIFSSIVFYFLIPYLSQFFNEPKLLVFLPPLVFYLFFSFFAITFVSFLRGYNYSFPHALRSVIEKGIIFILLIFLVFFNLSFEYIAWIWSFSLFFFLVFILIKYFKHFKGIISGNCFLSTKKLFVFSLPLLLLGLTTLVIVYTDTIMLGMYLPTNIVGIYSAAAPLARFIPILLGAAAWLYLPITSKLWAQNRKKDLKKIYATITKWIVSLTLPLFLVLFLFPSIVLKFLFGAEYISAASVLSILSIGFFFHTLMGPNDVGLIAIGENKSVAILRGIAALLNLFLNFLLIPYLGMVGAAVASTSSWILSNLLISIQLYRRTKIHPFSIDLVKPLIISTIIIGIIYIIAKQFTFSGIGLGILGIIFLGVYSFVVLLTKSFNKEDLELLLLLENKVGFNLTFFKRIIRKFI